MRFTGAQGRDMGVQIPSVYLVVLAVSFCPSAKSLGCGALWEHWSERSQDERERQEILCRTVVKMFGLLWRVPNVQEQGAPHTCTDRQEGEGGGGGGVAWEREKEGVGVVVGWNMPFFIPFIACRLLHLEQLTISCEMPIYTCLSFQAKTFCPDEQACSLIWLN